MTVVQLKIKHRKEKQERKVKMVRNGILCILMVIATVAFVDVLLNAWEQEIANHGNYNREYIQQMENKRAN